MFVIIHTVWQGRGRFFCAGTNVSREDGAARKNRRQRVAEITAVRVLSSTPLEGH